MVSHPFSLSQKNSVFGVLLRKSDETCGLAMFGIKKKEPVTVIVELR